MANTKTKFINTWKQNCDYFDMLKLMASLSKLFSENTIPYIDYRLAENIFCKYYNAINDARSCTAYDARIGELGIGIKTFGIPNTYSIEKIAEFNKVKPTLDTLHGDSLARKLAEFRNDRIEFANNIYNVSDSLYHIVGRKDEALCIFNTPYSLINLDKIENVKETNTSISFISDSDFYTFNKSKSVLMKKFELPQKYHLIPINIIEDPFELLSELLNKKNSRKLIKSTSHTTNYIKGEDYVILPLYSTSRKQLFVAEKSGLNQWNAGGRPRHEDELYIPIPSIIHKKYPKFFPSRNTHFELELPNGNTITAKVCQENGKALMSNPNKDLGNWILRSVLQKKPGELVTIDDLNRYGIDSVLILKHHKRNDLQQEKFSISFTASDYERYIDFIR